MKKVVLGILICLSINTFAQKKQYSTIYLKTGSVIRGEIIENIQDSIIKLKTRDNNLWVFKHSEILKFEEKNTESDFLNNATGFVFSFKMLISPVVNESGADPIISPGLVIGAGYRYKDRFYSGIISGIEYWGTTTVPILLEQHISFYRRNISPFFYLQSGYCIALQENNESRFITENEWKGGLAYGLGVGIKAQKSKHFGIYVSFGYRHQILKNNFTRNDRVFLNDNLVDNFVEVKKNIKFNRLSITVGFLF